MIHLKIEFKLIREEKKIKWKQHKMSSIMVFFSENVGLLNINREKMSENLIKSIKEKVIEVNMLSTKYSIKKLQIPGTILNAKEKNNVKREFELSKAARASLL